MVKGSQDNTEGALTKAFDEFIPVCYVFIHYYYVFLLFIVESMIVYVGTILHDPHSWDTCRAATVPLGCRTSLHVLLLDSFLNVKEVYGFVVEDFLPFIVPELLVEDLSSLHASHGKRLFLLNK